jgi:hypothetical protein
MAAQCSAARTGAPGMRLRPPLARLEEDVESVVELADN